VLELKAPDIQQEIAHNELGTAVHSSLEKYFKELTGLKSMDLEGKPLKRKDIDFEKFWKIFMEELKSKDFYKALSPERKILLEETAKFRLKRYLLYNLPLETRLVALETSFYKPFFIPELGELTFYGKIDRIDKMEREGDTYYLIIDYKTGRISEPDKKFWHLKACQLREYDENSLRLLRKHLASLQLLFYVYLAGHFLKEKLKDRAWSWAMVRPALVELKKEGNLKELSLKKSEYPFYSRWFEEEFEPCISFLIRHILESPHWYPAESHSTCTYCEYRSICRHGF
jgi:ATP-dependent helicase/DNAse subunit B